MTIDEAIKELMEELDEYLLGDRPEFVSALKLGIEALKQIRVDRRNRLPFRAVLLSGETRND